jgi:hypothetical protein
VRQQIKWFTFVASFAGLLYFFAMIGQVVVVWGSDDSIAQIPLWFEIVLSLAGLGFAGVPVAIGLAVLKYRLYDIDVVINLTLVYGSLTSMLVALYFGCVATTQTILRAHRPDGTTTTRHSHLHPRDSGTIQPIETPHSIVYRPPFLPQEVRRKKDPGSLLRQASRRDRPGDAEPRSC